MIKYLGSKRRLVPVLADLAAQAQARTALDLFTGTTRVAQAFKRLGAVVTAVDTARYSEVLARCAIATDAAGVDRGALAAELARLDALPGRPGYVTEVFCRTARYFHPDNGARIDAIRDAIAADHAGGPLEPLLLASLLLAADRVDSTTGVQMAFLKRWAPRAGQRLVLRPPPLLAGPGRALRADAEAVAASLGGFDLAYLDPPYNQHRYFTNYHVWETLIAWDAPAHYGVACKRADARDAHTRTAFDARATMPAALAGVLAGLDARLVVVSNNDEAWLTLDELVELCRCRGEVAVMAFDARRYVGAQIGVHDPNGRRVGEPGRLRNVEYLLVCGDRADVARLDLAAAAARYASGTASALHPAATLARRGASREADQWREMSRPGEGATTATSA